MKDDPQFVRLANGTLIDVDSGRAVVSTEINKAFSDAPSSSTISKVDKRTSQSDFDGGVRRYLDDLPASPAQSRAVALVCAYSVFGLANADIGFILGVDHTVIEAVKATADYAKFLDGMLQQLREHDTNKIRKKLNAEAEGALDNIVKLAKSADEKIKLAASKDVLDRHEKGYGTQGENVAQKSSLTIRIIDDRDNPLDKVEVEIDG